MKSIYQHGPYIDDRLRPATKLYPKAEPGQRERNLWAAIDKQIVRLQEAK